MMRRGGLALLIVMAPLGAAAQQGGGVAFVGPIVPGHCSEWYASNILEDSGDICAAGSGSGTVSSGTTNELAYYAADGDTVSGITTLNNGVLITSGVGKPSIATTLPSGLTLPSPILTTPNLGTPSAINLANAVALPLSSITGFGTGIATFLATPSSGNLAAALTDETGSGAAVFANTPTLVTPILGAATATSINGNAITAGTGTLTLGSATLNAGAGGTLQSAAFIATGTSGATVPLLNGNNTYSGTSNFTGLIVPNTSFTPTCGTGCASITGNDQKFVVTTGAVQTSITVNFGHTWTATPVCSLASNTTASVIDIASVSTGAITFGASVGLTGNLIYANCY